MESYRFVQINHLHPNNSLHLSQFDVERFNDVSPDAFKPAGAAREKAQTEAIGDILSHVSLDSNIYNKAARVFYLLAGSMIHDIYSLRVMLGSPSEVVSAEVWSEGTRCDDCVRLSEWRALCRNMGRPARFVGL